MTSPASLVSPALQEEILRMGAEAMARIKDLEDQLAAKWLPRDTAPRDGTEVLLYVPTAKCIAQAAWDGKVWKYDIRDKNEFGWDDEDFSHWQPMPLPPAA